MSMPADANRQLTYAQALYEATYQEMARDPAVIVLGQGVDDPVGLYGTTLDLHRDFGPDRAFDTPLAEDGLAGVAIGAALAGLRPVNVHIRMDFMLLCMNQIINMAAKLHYTTGGAVKVPVVFRGVIGRSWGQGAQHSQALQALFMHVPGLKVVAPTTPYDAKGMLTAAIRDDNPVIVVEHRMLYKIPGHVPAEPYTVPFGQARVLAPGDDLTIVAVSHMVLEALRARTLLAEQSISAEVIDPVSLAPLDIDTIAASVLRTGRLLVVDAAWTTCGASAEILTQVVETLQGERPLRVARMGFANTPCPTTKPLENLFYPNSRTIAARGFALVRPAATPWLPAGTGEAQEVAEFRGPF